MSLPLSFPGSKANLAPWIIRHFPPHHTYVDVFGGSAAVLLSKQPSPVEVYNDINSNLVEFFRVLRDPAQAEELYRRLRLTPHSREEFQLALSSGEGDSVESARRFFVRSRQSFSGLGTFPPGALPSKWSYCVTESAGGMSARTRKWLSAVEALDAAAERFRTIQVEHLDFADLIPRYDRPDTLFFVDPPYLHSTRARLDLYGEHELTVERHRELADILRQIKGMAVVCGYPSPEYEEFYAGWMMLSLDVAKHTAVVHSDKRPRLAPLGRSRERECIWISPKVRLEFLQEQLPLWEHGEVAP